MPEIQTIDAYNNVGGNYYDKYNSRNPIAKKLMAGFLSAFDEMARQTGAMTAFEVGCGEGHLSMRLLATGVAVRGCDVERDVVENANQTAERKGHGRPFCVQSIYDIGADEPGAELVICCEVLEHLPVTSIALERLSMLAHPYLLVSVPREPIWRLLNVMRGKYLGQLGNTPGHIQHWSSGRFVDLLKGSFEILAVRRPLPWTMVLCKSRQ
jgi:2-polyprenyl-3-methyl-5-hydroxy-6-metoxy-1,4-benzoquinol methylase